MSRKAAASEGWLQKAAEEADLIVDGEDDSDEEFYQVVQSNLTLTLVRDVHLLQGLQTGKNGSGVSTKQQVAVARAALNSLLNTPLDQVKASNLEEDKVYALCLLQASYCGAYPTMGGLLPGEVLAPKKEDAVESLEASITSSKALMKGNLNEKKKVKHIKHKKKKNVKPPEAVSDS